MIEAASHCLRGTPSGPGILRGPGLGLSALLHTALLITLLLSYNRREQHIALPGPAIPVLLLSATSAPATLAAADVKPPRAMPAPVHARSSHVLAHRSALAPASIGDSASPATKPAKPEATAAAAPATQVEAQPRASDALPDTPPPLAYLIRLSRIVSRSQQYPWSARIGGQQGEVLVRLHLHRDGRVLGVSLLQSSGTAALDEEACEVMRRIARFPPFPVDYQPWISEFDIDQPVSFLHYLS